MHITDDIIISSDESEYSDDDDGEFKDTFNKISPNIDKKLRIDDKLVNPISNLHDVFTKKFNQRIDMFYDMLPVIQSKDKNVPKNEATILTKLEHSYIENNLTTLYRLASTVPVVFISSSFPCELCDFQTSKEGRLRQHMTGVQFRCDLCGEKLETEM